MRWRSHSRLGARHESVLLVSLVWITGLAVLGSIAVAQPGACPVPGCTGYQVSAAGGGKVGPCIHRYDESRIPVPATKDTGHAITLMHQAEMALANGDADAATVFLKEATQLDPHIQGVDFWLGLSRARRAEKDEANAPETAALGYHQAHLCVARSLEPPRYIAEVLYADGMIEEALARLLKQNPALQPTFAAQTMERAAQKALQSYLAALNSPLPFVQDEHQRRLAALNLRAGYGNLREQAVERATALARDLQTTDKVAIGLLGRWDDAAVDRDEFARMLVDAFEMMPRGWLRAGGSVPNPVRLLMFHGVNVPPGDVTRDGICQAIMALYIAHRVPSPAVDVDKIKWNKPDWLTPQTQDVQALMLPVMRAVEEANPVYSVANPDQSLVYGWRFVQCSRSGAQWNVLTHDLLKRQEIPPLGNVLTPTGPLGGPERTDRTEIPGPPSWTDLEQMTRYMTPEFGPGTATIAEVDAALGAAERQLDRAWRPKQAKCPDCLVARAWGLRQQGQLAQAQQELRKALALDPDSALAHNVLGSVLDGLGQAEAARAEYEQALRIDPQLPEKRYNTGRSLFDQAWRLREAVGRPQRGAKAQPEATLCAALAEMDEVLRLDPQFAEAWLTKGEVLQTQGRWNDALAALDQALAATPRLGDAAAVTGGAHLVRGEVRHAQAGGDVAAVLDAARRLEAAAADGLGRVDVNDISTPSHVVPWGEAANLDRAVAAATAADAPLPQAITEYQAAQGAGAKALAAEIALAAGRAQYDQARILEARAQAQGAMAATQIAEGQRCAAQAAWAAANARPAAAVQGKQAEADRRQAEATATLTAAQGLLGEAAGALQATVTGLSTATGDPEVGPLAAMRAGVAAADAARAHASQATIAAALGQANAAPGHVTAAVAQLDAALALFDQAVADPELAPTAQSAAGATYLCKYELTRDAQFLESAIARCTDAVKADPQLAAAHNNLAVALYEQGRLTSAGGNLGRVAEPLERAGALDGTSGVAQANLAALKAAQGDLAGAAAAAQRATALEPSLVAAHNNFAVAMAAKWGVEYVDVGNAQKRVCVATCLGKMMPRLQAAALLARGAVAIDGVVTLATVENNLGLFAFDASVVEAPGTPPGEDWLGVARAAHTAAAKRLAGLKLPGVAAPYVAGFGLSRCDLVAARQTQFTVAGAPPELPRAASAYFGQAMQAFAPAAAVLVEFGQQGPEAAMADVYRALNGFGTLAEAKQAWQDGATAASAWALRLDGAANACQATVAALTAAVNATDGDPLDGSLWIYLAQVQGIEATLRYVSADVTSKQLELQAKQDMRAGDPAAAEAKRAQGRQTMQAALEALQAGLAVAEPAARRAFDLRPTDPRAIQTLRDVLSQQGKTAEAQAIVAKAKALGGAAYEPAGPPDPWPQLMARALRERSAREARCIMTVAMPVQP